MYPPLLEIHRHHKNGYGPAGTALLEKKKTAASLL